MTFIYLYINTLVSLIVSLLSLTGQTQQQAETSSSSAVIIAYYAGSRDMPVADIKADKITHINYAFANIENGEVVEGNEAVDYVKLKQLVQLRSRHPHLKLLISVGGWSWSDHFSDAALNETSRSVFARSAVSYLVRHQLDGIDLDWEYPGQPGEGNKFRSEDKQNFTLLLAAVRKELDSLSNLTDKNYLLTIASAANQRYLDHTEMHLAHQYLDYVNIMTYDFFGGWSNTTGHHTALNGWNNNEHTNFTTQAVQQHLQAGVPASKIVIGAAFYGRGWTGVAKDLDGPLGTTYDGKAFALSYDSISNINDPQYLTYWDEQAVAPYLWNAQTQTLITYDNPRSLKRKCQYVAAQGLAGVMFWEYTQDRSGVLVETLYNQLNQP